MSINFDELRQGIFTEHNKIRSNPSSYIEILQKQMTYFKGDILYRPKEVPIQTNEGVKAFEQAIEFLKVFLDTEFEGGRHQKRLDKLS